MSLRTSTTFIFTRRFDIIIKRILHINTVVFFLNKAVVREVVE